MDVSRCEFLCSKVGFIDGPYLLVQCTSFNTFCSWKDTPLGTKRSASCLVFLCMLDLKNPLIRGKIGLLMNLM